jgi:hypothetical protein
VAFLVLLGGELFCPRMLEPINEAKEHDSEEEWENPNAYEIKLAFFSISFS